MNWPPGQVVPEPEDVEPVLHVRRGATFETRAVPFVVDVALILLVWFLAGRAVVITLGNILGRLGFMIGIQFYISQPPPAVCALPLLAVAGVAYFPMFEAMAAGSPGKWLFMLRVLSLDGTLPKPRAAVLRSLYRIIDIVTAYEAMKPPLYQRMGDKAAGTTVTSLDYVPADSPIHGWQLIIPAVVFFALTSLLRLLVVLPFLRLR